MPKRVHSQDLREVVGIRRRQQQLVEEEDLVIRQWEIVGFQWQLVAELVVIQIWEEALQVALVVVADIRQWEVDKALEVIQDYLLVVHQTAVVVAKGIPVLISSRHLPKLMVNNNQ